MMDLHQWPYMQQLERLHNNAVRAADAAAVVVRAAECGLLDSRLPEMGNDAIVEGSIQARVPILSTNVARTIITGISKRALTSAVKPGLIPCLHVQTGDTGTTSVPV
jgi:hypothetical protein